MTDRVDLDKQLGNTFTACGLDKHRAKTGRDLLELVSEKKATIVTTLIHKDEDLQGTLTSIHEETAKLPQRYSDL